MRVTHMVAAPPNGSQARIGGAALIVPQMLAFGIW
jgi:hypothetical protein